ncbi:MAG: DUF5103 domain-containing protein [Flavobacterium sp.]|nr:DUF5103 domain-containing protein [Flavobacterium sp.]
MKRLFFFSILLWFISASAQVNTDNIVMPCIKTVKLFQQNNQESLPIINLNSTDLLELHFDDMDGYVKNYYYTFTLCNANWQPADLSSFDYLKGYQQQRLNQYRPSSIAQTKYVHYQTILPDRNCTPTKSGNYLLKVFLNGDTTQLAFTKRLYVLDSRANVGGRSMVPFDNELSRTHQKIQFSVDVTQLNAQNPMQQITTCVMQNNRTDNMQYNVPIAFVRGNLLEYDGERGGIFEAGKEYRWVDLRSFRFESERIASIDKNSQPNNIFVKPDGPRVAQRYLYYKDYNGWMNILTTENVNNWWQTDYANVTFTFVPEGNQPFASKDIYLMGELTNNKLNSNSLLEYNAAKGVYQKTLYLKQGFYNYTYVSKDKVSKKTEATVTEGNYWETENDYTIFVYYRSYSQRHDELVGIATVNSRTGRVGY